MGKAEAGSVKAIGNAIKAKGLGKLRWYCQACEKQCRDENGFRCHQASESHLRQMALVAQDAGGAIDRFSRDFEQAFLEHMRRCHPSARVEANKVYNELIHDRHHVHMNATQWLTLTEFVKHLGKEGLCRVDETERGWFIQMVRDDPVRKAEEERRRRRAAREEEEARRAAKELEGQLERARKRAREGGEEGGEKEGVDAEAEAEALLQRQREGGAAIRLTLGSGRGGGGAGEAAAAADAAAAAAAVAASARAAALAGRAARPAAPPAAAAALFGGDEEEDEEQGGAAAAGAAAAAAGAPAAGGRLSKLDEIMLREQQKQQQAAAAAAAAAAAKAQRPPPAAPAPAAAAAPAAADDDAPWPLPGAVVRVLAPSLKAAGLYRRKGAVRRCEDGGFVAEVEILPSAEGAGDGGAVVRVDQAELETVLPAPGGRVVVVAPSPAPPGASARRAAAARLRGKRGTLAAVDTEAYRARVRLDGEEDARWFDYEEVCKVVV